MHSQGTRCGEDFFGGGQSSLGGRAAPNAPPTQHGDPWGDHTAPGPPFPRETGAQNPIGFWPQSQSPQSEPSFHSLEFQRGQGWGGWGKGQGCHQGQTAGRKLLRTVVAPRGRWALKVDASVSGVNNSAPRVQALARVGRAPSLSLGSERFRRAPCFLLGADAYPPTLGTPTLGPTVRGRERIGDKATRPCKGHEAVSGFSSHFCSFEKSRSLLLKLKLCFPLGGAGWVARMRTGACQPGHSRSHLKPGERGHHHGDPSPGASGPFSSEDPGRDRAHVTASHPTSRRHTPRHSVTARVTAS